MATFEFAVETSAREWQRQFANVVRSLGKTVTEGVTNSDSSYKRKYSLPDDSGLVQLILNQAKGTRLDSHALRQQIATTKKREFEIHLFTARGHERPARTCDIVDFAEGLSTAELERAFKHFADNKSEVSKGRPGRSLFGRGISDVLFGHKCGEFHSYKDGILTVARFEMDKKAGKPKIAGDQSKNPSKTELSKIHLRKDDNGSCVRFELADDCRIPDEGSIVQQLSRFYMLRLITSDPNSDVRLFRYRAGGKVHEDTLEYDFPLGEVIGKIDLNVPVPDDLTTRAFQPLKVDGVVLRAVSEAPLRGRESRDARENGLLIVDEKDAVLDLTFLPEFEGAPYLSRIYGIVRITGIRAVLEHFLDSGKESPLTTTRDGFDGRHEFTQHLFAALKKHLEPIYRKEEQRFKNADSHELSADAAKKLNEAMRQLNKYLADLMGSGDGENGDKEPKDVAIQFIPNETKLVVGNPKFVTLAVRTADIKSDGVVMIDSSNPRIDVFPSLLQLKKSADKFQTFRLSLKSDGLHESATITALADGTEGTLEANLNVTDVIAAGVIEPPLEMEFRPVESKGQPNRKHNAILFVNLEAIPFGRKIDVSIVKAQGGISLLDEGKQVKQVSIKVSQEHQLEQSKVARIPITWSGAGWGHFARIMAETKTTSGKLVTAVASLSIDQEEVGGLIKRIDYRDLENHKCSDLVDGCIYINSRHALNNSVFGANKESYNKSVESDHTAQFRLCSIITEQSVFRLAEDQHLKNKLLILPNAPVTSIREFVDDKTHEFAPRLLKILVTS